MTTIRSRKTNKQIYGSPCAMCKRNKCVRSFSASTMERKEGFRRQSIFRYCSSVCLKNAARETAFQACKSQEEPDTIAYLTRSGYVPDEVIRNHWVLPLYQHSPSWLFYRVHFNQLLNNGYQVFIVTHSTGNPNIIGEVEPTRLQDGGDCISLFVRSPQRQRAYTASRVLLSFSKRLFDEYDPQDQQHEDSAACKKIKTCAIETPKLPFYQTKKTEITIETKTIEITIVE